MLTSFWAKLSNPVISIIKGEGIQCWTARDGPSESKHLRQHSTRVGFVTVWAKHLCSRKPEMGPNCVVGENPAAWKNTTKHALS